MVRSVMSGENELPDLNDLTYLDERLRQVPTDRDQFIDAVAAARQMLERARETGDTQRQSRLLGYIGDACRVAGFLDDAVAMLTEALELARSRGDTRAETAHLIRLGEAYRYCEEFGKAEDALRTALVFATRDKSRNYVDFVHQHLGKCLLEQGRHDEAIRHFREALQLRRAKGNQALIASTEEALVAADQRQREPATGGRHPEPQPSRKQ